MSIKKKDIKYITEEDLSELCRRFHKWFRVADCKNEADIDMFHAIKKLDNEEYAQAFRDSLSEIGIKIKKAWE